VNRSGKLAEIRTGSACAIGAWGKRYSYAPRWSASYGVPNVEESAGKKNIWRNIPSFPASLATTRLGRRKIAGGRNTGIRDGARRSAMEHFTLLVFRILANRSTAVRRRNSTRGLPRSPPG